MKLIEALKKLKTLKIKVDDLAGKIGKCSADLDFETPLYPDQRGKVQEWLQSHSDSVKEILRLRIAIQRTNLNTPVAIEIGGVVVTKTIAEWIHRRKDLAGFEKYAWQMLTDKGLKDQRIKTTNDGAETIARVRRYYDPVERDRKVEIYDTEPRQIDAALEIANAITDVIE